MFLTGQAKTAGIVGWPVSHSLSPVIHNFWLRKFAIDGVYMPLPVAPDHFEIAIRGLQAAGFRGLNVTIPHKETAFYLVDRHDDAAAATGAVNTLVFHDDGTIEGRNSDASGFIAHLGQAAPRWRKDGRVVVLGAGGAARAIIWALLKAGISDIAVVNRSQDRAASLAARFGQRVTPHKWSDLPDLLRLASLLINTTSLGMIGQPALEIDLDTLPRPAVVSDIVYAPLETELLAAARSRGHTVVDGLGMLLHQARAGFAAWFGVMPDIDEALRRAVLEA